MKDKLRKFVNLMRTKEGHNIIKHAIIQFGIAISFAYFFIYYMLLPSQKLIDSYHNSNEPLPVIAWGLLVMSAVMFIMFPLQRVVSYRIAKLIKCIPNDTTDKECNQNE